MAKTKPKPAAKAPAKQAVKAKPVSKAKARTLARPVARKAPPKEKPKAKAAPKTTKDVEALTEAPEAVKAMQDQFLTVVEQRLVEEYIVDLNGTKAYMRVCPGVTEASAGTLSSRALGKVEVQKALLAAMEARSVRTGITADRVLMELWRVAIADTRELIDYQVGSCRYCWGEDNRYQRTDAEMERERQQHEEAQDEAQAKDNKHRHVPFDEQGGTGFDPRKEPNAACPECWGHGKGRAVIKDTRRLSKEAAVLYAGVKMTKEGLEVKLHSKMDAIEKLSKHLGLYERDNEQTGKGLANGLADLLKGMKRSSLPVVAEPEA